MTCPSDELPPKSRLKALLEHFSRIEDPREQWKVRHPLPEILLLVVCGTICDCDDYEGVSAWGKAHLKFLREHLPYEHGIPGERWLTILMNRIPPDLFAAAFTDWTRETWPGVPEQVAIDGKTSRRSHDRSAGKAALHLVSAFATTQRLVLGQEAVETKSNETTAIPLLIERLAANDGLKGALVSIDAIATNAKIAGAIREAGADYLLAVKANQPTIRSEVETLFDEASADELDRHRSMDKGHGRIEERIVTVCRQTDWLSGERRFPGELRLPDAASVIRVVTRTELADRCRVETRYFISSASLTAERAANGVRGHWAIENSLHWVLDVVFADDQSRLRKGHGAHNMAVVRHFALNLVRSAPGKQSIKLRRKRAGWDTEFLNSILNMERR